MIPVFKTLTDYNNTDSLGNRFRNARFKMFNERLQAFGSRRVTLLDVGGHEPFWVARGYAGHPSVDITLLNLEIQPTHYDNMTSVKGDACDMREFADRQFDIVFSNSVIEHLRTYDGQRAMAREVQRVGRYHFVQTPNRSFFFEPHYLLPWFQFMPRRLQHAVLTRTSLSRHPRMRSDEATDMLNEIRLLTEAEFRSLFPQSQLYKERLLRFTKSFTAHNL